MTSVLALPEPFQPIFRVLEDVAKKEDSSVTFRRIIGREHWTFVHILIECDFRSKGESEALRYLEEEYCDVPKALSYRVFTVSVHLAQCDRRFVRKHEVDEIAVRRASRSRTPIVSWLDCTCRVSTAYTPLFFLPGYMERPYESICSPNP
jgi:hypothetical protein